MAIQSVLQRSYSLDDFARLNEIALTTVRGEIKSGRLVARKIGRRTIITRFTLAVETALDERG